MDQRVEGELADALRYFGTPAEDLHCQLVLVAEGLKGINERLDRFQNEVAREFLEVKTLIRDGYVALDRRVRRLEGQRRRRPR